MVNRLFQTTEEKNKIMESLNALNEVSLSRDNDAISKLRSFLGEQYQDWIEIDFSVCVLLPARRLPLL